MKLKTLLSLGFLIFSGQLLYMDIVQAKAQYCESKGLHRQRGKRVKLYYDLSHPAARNLCDLSAGVFERDARNGRLFHQISTAGIPTPTAAPRMTRNPAFLSKGLSIQPEPLFTPGGQVTDFISAYTRRSPGKSKRSRYIMQWPSYRANGQNQLACGSEHIRRSRSKAYMKPVSACMLASAAQEWRKTVCPGNTPDCQFRFGDMTFGEKYRKPNSASWPHKSHRHGNCVDVWPIRKPGHSGNVWVGEQTRYDRTRTRQLIKIMQKWGGATPNGKGGSNQIFFDDAVLVREGIVRPLNKTHLDHIHICFPETAANRKKCQNNSFDTKLCPGLGDPSREDVPMAGRTGGLTNTNL